MARKFFQGCTRVSVNIDLMDIIFSVKYHLKCSVTPGTIKGSMDHLKAMKCVFIYNWDKSLLTSDYIR